MPSTGTPREKSSVEQVGEAGAQTLVWPSARTKSAARAGGAAGVYAVLGPPVRMMPLGARARSSAMGVV